MNFANPSYLWAFAGLAVPLAIHLLSRKEGKVIRVGSLRHVEESNTSQFKSIRLNEFLLLLLRFLMISMVVLFLAGTSCTDPAKQEKWLMIEEGIDNQIDSAGYEIHQLPVGDYWKVAKELGELPHDVVVISYSNISRFNGERLKLPDNVRWITIEKPSTKFPATAWQAGDTVFVRTANSSSLLTSYSTSIGVPDSIGIIKPEEIKVSTDSKIVAAAIQVLKTEFKLPIRVQPNGDQKISFSNTTASLVERISPTEVVINERLDQDVAINENLVIALFNVFYPGLKEPEIARQKDARIMPEQLAWSNSTGSATVAQANFSGIEKYLILLFILTLATERFVAIRRNQ